MQQVIPLYKPVGFTPLQLITLFRKQYLEYQNVKLSYAGRLDPMAEGLLLILVGEENKKRKKYEDLEKEYVCDVLFGIETDTYDILGKITKYQSIKDTQYIFTQVKKYLATFVGKQQQPYPPYSSQPVNGRPLYYWARQNKLPDIMIPVKDIEIYDMQLQSEAEVSTVELKTTILERLDKVTGDFRQEEIKKIWKNFFERNNKQKFFSVMTLRVSCSSGTYIRSLAHTLGEKLGTGAIALGIKRTKIGNYTLNNALYL